MGKPDQDLMTAVMDGWLVKDGHQYPMVVQFEDTDAGGIVYHSNYINFAERGRTALLRLCDIKMQDLIDRDEVIVIRRVEIDYKRPSKMGERLIITSDEFEMTKVSLYMRQTVADEDGNIRAVLKVHGAFVSVSTGRPIRIPEDVRDKLDAISQQAASL